MFSVCLLERSKPHMDPFPPPPITNRPLHFKCRLVGFFTTYSVNYVVDFPVPFKLTFNRATYFNTYNNFMISAENLVDISEACV